MISEKFHCAEISFKGMGNIIAFRILPSGYFFSYAFFFL